MVVRGREAGRASSQMPRNMIINAIACFRSAGRPSPLESRRGCRHGGIYKHVRLNSPSSSTSSSSYSSSFLTWKTKHPSLSFASFLLYFVCLYLLLILFLFFLLILLTIVIIILVITSILSLPFFYFSK